MFRHYVNTRRITKPFAKPVAVTLGLLAAALLAAPQHTAYAHGHVQVGNYELTIGFHVEPAIQGEPNGLDLFVARKQPSEAGTSMSTAGMTTTGIAAGESMTATESMTASEGASGTMPAAAPGEAADEDHGAPSDRVNGLADSLRAEIILGASKKELKLEPQEGQDGAYTAFLLPTQVGDYTWHIFGDIEGTPVDVSMTSSPDTFGAVESKDSMSFPGAEADAAKGQDQVATQGQQASTALEQEVGRATTFGILGILLGLAGTLVGIVSMRQRRIR